MRGVSLFCFIGIPAMLEPSLFPLTRSQLYRWPIFGRNTREFHVTCGMRLSLKRRRFGELICEADALDSELNRSPFVVKKESDFGDTSTRMGTCGSPHLSRTPRIERHVPAKHSEDMPPGLEPCRLNSRAVTFIHFNPRTTTMGARTESGDRQE